jgi:hypothetical protein
MSKTETDEWAVNLCSHARTAYNEKGEKVQLPHRLAREVIRENAEHQARIAGERRVEIVNALGRVVDQFEMP